MLEQTTIQFIIQDINKLCMGAWYFVQSHNCRSKTAALKRERDREKKKKNMKYREAENYCSSHVTVKLCSLVCSRDI